MSIAVGDEIPGLAKHPSSIAMFRFSAVMWNAHRTHIDHPYATEVEGHGSTLTQDYLLATYIAEMLTAWGGPKSRIKRLSYSNRGPVHANTTVQCWGRVTDIEATDEGQLVSLEVGLNNHTGMTAVPGSAKILIPAGA
jgi:hydroxyacyl-ACP dehydratase HTD2-like protein with hotdog domain